MYSSCLACIFFSNCILWTFKICVLVKCNNYSESLQLNFHERKQPSIIFCIQCMSQMYLRSNCSGFAFTIHT